MATASVNALSAGVQQLYKSGLLPTALKTVNLTARQLNALASSSISSQEVSQLFGSGISDSVSLSSAATNALLQEINPSASATVAGGDPLSLAVSAALTSSVNAAAAKFLPQGGVGSSGGGINLVG